MILAGALAFGFVVGWVTYRTLRRSTVTGLNDIAAVIGAVGGAAVLALFPSASDSFGAYCIGLFFGFITYLSVAWKLATGTEEGLSTRLDWLGGPRRATSDPNGDDPDPRPRPRD